MNPPRASNLAAMVLFLEQSGCLCEVLTADAHTEKLSCEKRKSFDAAFAWLKSWNSKTHAIVVLPQFVKVSQIILNAISPNESKRVQVMQSGFK